MKSSNSVSNFLLNVREVEIAFGVIKCRNDDVACPKQAETEIGSLLDALINSTTMHSAGRKITNEV